MSALQGVGGAPWLQILGWTLLHSLWQGALVALLLAGLLRAARRAPAALRYALACTALGVVVALAAVTAASVRGDWAEHVACWRTHEGGASPLPRECFEHGIVPPEGREHYDALASDRSSSGLGRASRAATPASAGGAALWLAAVSLLLLRTAAAWRAVARLRRRGTRPLAGPLREALGPLQRSIGIARPVALLRSTEVDVPTVIGLRHPAVLFPPAVLDRLPPTALEAVLAHELAHVRRHDFAANLLQVATDSLLFFHPPARWISGRIREERELCCDEVALRAIPGRLPAYLRALLAVDGLRLGAPGRHALAVTGGGLLPRARRLAEGSAPAWSRRSALAVLLGGALFWAPALRLEDAVDLAAWAVMTDDIRARRAPPTGDAPAPPHAGH